MQWSYIRYVLNSTNAISVLEAAAEGREGRSEKERPGAPPPLVVVPLSGAHL